VGWCDGWLTGGAGVGVGVDTGTVGSLVTGDVLPPQLTAAIAVPIRAITVRLRILISYTTFSVERLNARS
jgi:hypothetical protein